MGVALPAAGTVASSTAPTAAGHLDADSEHKAAVCRRVHRHGHPGHAGEAFFQLPLRDMSPISQEALRDSRHSYLMRCADPHDMDAVPS